MSFDPNEHDEDHLYDESKSGGALSALVTGPVKYLLIGGLFALFALRFLR